jgi:hypothetical protein
MKNKKNFDEEEQEDGYYFVLQEQPFPIYKKPTDILCPALNANKKFYTFKTFKHSIHTKKEK